MNNKIIEELNYKIDNQENIIRDLLKENKQLKEKIKELKDELVKDRMEQFDDYVIYLLNKYIDMIDGDSNE